MWLRLLLTSLLANINLYEVLFFVLSNVKIPFIKRLSPSKAQVAILEKRLQHGDLVFGRRDWFLKNLFVRGRYQHVGTWDAENKVIMEMQNEGYVETPLAIFCARYTEVGANSCLKFTNVYRRKFVKQMKAFSDREYDSRFSWNTHSMYCSESVFHADIDKRIGYQPEKLFWKEVFVPSTLWSLPTMKKNFVLTKKGLKLS